MEDINKTLGTLLERSENMAERADEILDQLKRLNSKVAHHETEIHRIKIEIAESNGITKGINKTLAVGLTIMGILAGVVATMLWH